MSIYEPKVTDFVMKRENYKKAIEYGVKILTIIEFE
jgi:hypothetical protein